MNGTAARPGPRNIPALLAQLRAEAFSGAVTVAADPGGVIHLRGGLIVSVSTPGAPSPETLLLKSLRITERVWSAALAEARRGTALGTAVVERGLISAAELEVVCAAAVFDGAFSLSLRRAEDWRMREQGPEPEFTAASGIEPSRLGDETRRRTALLTELVGPLAEFAAARPRPALRTGAEYLAARHHDILASADGRRTARDIAFVLGRGVFPVMLDLARLGARGFIRLDAGREVSHARSVATRSAEAPTRPADDGMAPPSPLPRRPARGRARSSGAAAGSAAGSEHRGQVGPAQDGHDAAAADRPTPQDPTTQRGASHDK